MPSLRRRIWSWIVLAILLAVTCGLLISRAWREGAGPAPLAIPEETSERLFAYRQLCEAKELAAQERYGEAAALFEQVARAQVGTTYGWDAEIRAAFAQGHLGHHERALARLERAVRECPFEELTPVAHIAVAQVQSLAGNADLGLRLLEEQIHDQADQSPEICAQALFAMTAVHGRRQEFGLVRADLLRIIEHFPGSENQLARAAERQLDSLSEMVSAYESRKNDPWGDHTQTRLIEKLPPGESRWDRGRYLIMREIELPAGASLQISAGAELRFGARGGLRIAGRLEVQGTSEAPVRLGPLSGEATRAWWQGLKLGGGGSAVLHHCRLTGADIALQADEGGSAGLDQCTIDQPARRGIRISHDTHVRMDGSDIVGCHGTAVECGPAGKIEIERCRILQTSGDGFAYRDGAPGCVLRDTIVDVCGNHGLLLRSSNSSTQLPGGGEPLIDHCIVRGSRAHGVRCTGGATPAIRNSEISGNGGIGVWFEERWNAALQDSRIVHNRGGGVLAEMRSAGVFQRNLIADNGAFGLQLRLDCHPVIVGNAFLRNKSVGLWLRENSVPQELANNIFTGNGEAALRHESDAVLKAGENWWGSSEEAEIRQAIQDRDENPAWGTVEYAGFLTAPPARAVATAPAE